MLLCADQHDPCTMGNSIIGRGELEEGESREDRNDRREGEEEASEEIMEEEKEMMKHGRITLKTYITETEGRGRVLYKGREKLLE